MTLKLQLTLTNGRQYDQHIIHQQATLASEPLRHETSDCSTNHSTHAEDGHCDGPNHGDLARVNHAPLCAVRLQPADPVFYQLQGKQGWVISPPVSVKACERNKDSRQ